MPREVPASRHSASSLLPSGRETGGRSAKTWRAYAFGLNLLGDFEVPGLMFTDEPSVRPTTSLTFVDRGTLDASWNKREAVRVLDRRDEQDHAFFTIDFHPVHGYRVAARTYGRFIVSPDGARVLCAPFQGRAWRWQRLLIARVLPLAATLQGLEVLHASAVEIDGHVVGVLGPSGMGKSSLAAQLVLQGATFFTDDVLALESGADGHLRAHPGLSVLALRVNERDALREGQAETLGSILSRGGKTHYVVAQPSRSAPLGALYFLERHSEKESLLIERILAPSPTMLLGSTFEGTVRTAARLHCQLDVCAKLAEQVPMFNLRVPSIRNAAQTATEVHAHVCSVVLAQRRAA